MIRRWIAIGLLALTGCGVAGGPRPVEQVAPQLPPDYIAVKRKDLGNSLLTGLLAYQTIRPYAEAACRPVGGGQSEDCFALQQLDRDLQTIWDQWWASLFEWPQTPAGQSVDWADLLRRLVGLVIKLVKYIPARAQPVVPLPGVPQLTPRILPQLGPPVEWPRGASVEVPAVRMAFSSARPSDR
jgi:hypothetical protein